MALTSAGFHGEVDEIEWSRLMGIIGNDGTVGMDVSPAGGNRTVEIAAGASNVGGVLALNSADENVQVPANASSMTRIDRIILVATWADSNLEFGYKQGTPSASPQPPTLTKNEGVHYEVSLAQVKVSPDQQGFLSSDITREAVPAAAGFYNIDSIARRPDAADGALVYYTPGGRLMVGDNGTYRDIASRLNSLADVPNKPPNWDNSNAYFVKSGVAYIRFEMRRTGNGFTNESVILGTMPSAARPASIWYGNVTNQSTGEAYIIEVRASDGRITMPNATFSSNHRLRGSISYPV